MRRKLQRVLVDKTVEKYYYAQGNQQFENFLNSVFIKANRAITRHRFAVMGGKSGHPFRRNAGTIRIMDNIHRFNSNIEIGKVPQRLY